jgi:hypothetical protein
MWVEDLASESPQDLSNGANDLASTDMKKPADLSAASDLSHPPDLTGVVVPPNGADTCTGAPTLPAGIDVTNQDTSSAADNYDYGSTGASAACSGAFGLYTYDGPDVVYTFDIPAGKTLKVVVTTTGWDGAVGIVDDCAMAKASCLAGSDELSGPETVQYANSGGSLKTVWIIVDSYLPSEKGKFSIRADVL